MSSFINKIGVSGALIASYFYSTPHFVWGTVGFVASSAVALFYLSKRWCSAEPNEWLLIIEDGKMKACGIGLKCFVWPSQTVVKFPSAIQRISFTATNVTKEMQGVQISGFAIWSVHREGDGPFKCYKYMQGGNAALNVQTMCESIVRHQIANHTMNDIIKNRNLLRDIMKKDLQSQLSGWGIWLETVEITDVQVCSKQLFEDLQAEFRQEAHLKAEQIRQTSRQQIEQYQLETSLILSKTREDTETQRIKIQNDEKIKRQQEEANYFKKQCELDKVKLNEQKEVELIKLETENQIENQKLENQQKLERQKNDFANELFKKQLEVQKDFTPQSMQKYLADSAERIYDKLPIKEIKLHQYIAPNSSSNIASMLPALGMMMQQNQELIQNIK